MDPIPHFLLLAFTLTLIASQPIATPTPPSITAARSLDAVLQDYAYRAIVPPIRTGVVHNASLPRNITGITLNEFEIPIELTITPYVERLALVYQNLGNWSTFYYSLPGHTFLAPVLGLLAYDARDLTATNQPELGLVVEGKPIVVRFEGVVRSLGGENAKCVRFGLDGLLEFEELELKNACLTTRQGHFSIVVDSTGEAPAPAPEMGEKNAVEWLLCWVLMGLVLLATVKEFETATEYLQDHTTKPIQQNRGTQCRKTMEDHLFSRHLQVSSTRRGRDNPVSNSKPIPVLPNIQSFLRGDQPRSFD
ncbi:hypothetical protein QJS10_CPA03g00039 [Acorus calamus]|uniref:Uncharacterized protein n=1 Tax=Acorus calamus TaxID=4465 RepID=A0AAV9F3S9_ACOCL|nr:hypothetical protein QJS10_CPA03g00039 [Acorus calamus]